MRGSPTVLLPSPALRHPARWRSQSGRTTRFGLREPEADSPGRPALTKPRPVGRLREFANSIINGTQNRNKIVIRRGFLGLRGRTEDALLRSSPELEA